MWKLQIFREINFHSFSFSAVLGLFNAAHEMVHGACDPAFPRLGQLIMDYDSPLKKLSEEFVPHARVLTRALMSLAAIYPRRNLSADQWR